MGSWIDNTTVKNQVAYFESINRPLIAQAEAADAPEILIWSHAGAVQDVRSQPLRTEKNKPGPPAKFRKTWKPSLPSPPWKETLEQAAKSLPGCSSLLPGNWPFSKPIWNASPLLPEENSKFSNSP